MPQNKNFSLIFNNKLFTGVGENRKSFNFDEKGLMNAREGDIIFKKGDNSDELYLIISGTVKLKFSNPDGVAIIENKGKNDFFGEKEFMEKISRKSSAVAETDCTIFRLTRNNYLELTSQISEIKNNLPDPNSSDLPEENLNETFEKKYIKRPWIIEQEKNIEVPTSLLDDVVVTDNIVTNIDSKLLEDKPVDELGTKVNLDIPSEDYSDVSIVGDNLEDIPGSEVNNMIKEFHSELDVSPSVIDISPTEPEKFDWNFKEANSDSNFDYDNLDEKENSLSEKEFLMSLESLRKINSKVEIGSLAEQIIKESISITGAEYGRIYLFDKAENEFYSFVPGTNEKNEIRIEFNEGLMGSAASEGKIINIQNPTNHEQYIAQVDNPGEDYLRNLLCFPLKNIDLQVIGLIELFNSPKNTFSDNEINILTHIAPNISQAIENYINIQHSPEIKEEIILKYGQNETITRITHSLINDLTVPVNIIRRYSDLIKRRDIAPEINPIIDMMGSQAELMIDNLKTMSTYFSGNEISQFEKLNFNEVMNEILILLVDYIEENKVKVYKKFIGDNLVQINQKALYQACYQITKNACEAMPDGGDIFVVTKYSERFVMAEFRDTGIGIPDTIMDKIFEPYFSDGKGERAGLGLAIADKIIKEHGGRIAASKTEGSGTVMSIYLPISN